MSYQSEYSGAQVDEAVGKALNPDATPTEGSNNLVQSGGVASAIESAVSRMPSSRLSNGVITGKLLKSTDDLDNIVDTGFYVYESSSVPSNAPTGLIGNTFYVLVISGSSASWVQLVWGVRNVSSNPVLYNNSAIRSKWAATGLSPWAYRNPPLSQYNVEFQLDESFIGRPVFVQQILLQSGSLSKTITGAVGIISVEGYCSNYGCHVPMDNGTGKYVRIETNGATITAIPYGASPGYIYLRVKYFKS